MSSWARSWAYEQRVGHFTDDGTWRKNPGAKSVLAALCEFPDQDGRCYIGQKRLAKMTDMDERTVRRHLSYLENTAKLIRRAERRREDGTRTSDYIWILAPPERLRPSEAGDDEKDQPKNGQPDKSPAHPGNLSAHPDNLSNQPDKSPGDPPSTGQSVRDNRTICPDQPDKSPGHDPSVDSLGDPSEELLEGSSPSEPEPGPVISPTGGMFVRLFDEALEGVRASRPPGRTRSLSGKWRKNLRRAADAELAAGRDPDLLDKAVQRLALRIDGYAGMELAEAINDVLDGKPIEVNGGRSPTRPETGSRSVEEGYEWLFGSERNERKEASG